MVPPVIVVFRPVPTMTEVSTVVSCETFSVPSISTLPLIDSVAQSIRMGCPSALMAMVSSLVRVMTILSPALTSILPSGSILIPAFASLLSSGLVTARWMTIVPSAAKRK